MKLPAQSPALKKSGEAPKACDRRGVPLSPAGAAGQGEGAARKSLLALAAVLSLFLPTAACGESLLLTGGVIHTVTGPAITNGALLIRDGRIERVGERFDAPADQTVRLDGRHVYPGLIAASTELGLVEIEAIRATRDAREVGEFTPDVQSWIAVNPDSELIPVARANGITHVLPVPQGGIVSGQSGLVALSGWTAEEMTVKQPVAVHVFWPDMDLDLTPRELARDKTRWKSPEEQARERRAKVKAVEDFFEEARAYARARDAGNGAAAPPPTPAWEALRPWARGELPLMIHADEFRQIKAAVRWAATNGHRFILAGGRDAWMLADELAAHRVPVIYEAVFALPARDERGYDLQFEAPARLHRAGVKVVFGFGGRHEASALRNLPYSAAQAVAFGLPPDEALKGLTLYPAQALGVADRLGSLAPGKEASLFVADGDILDIRSRVRRLWIAGQEISLETRHTRLYDKYRQRPKTAATQ
jgi:imidazolonepropionase-like amidohydrolase